MVIKSKYLFILVFVLLISCVRNKKTESSQSIEQASVVITEKNNKKVKEIEPEEEIVIDKNRFFIDEDWHPLRQTDFIKSLKERLKNKENKDVDETLYEDEFTVEFSLHDETRNFCLYHNIRKVKDFDIAGYEIFNYSKITQGYFNGLEIVKCFIEKDDVSVLWNADTGAMLIIGTDNPKYSTKRGICVGDSAEKIMVAYENDCTVEEYNYDEEKWETVSKKEKSGMWLLKSNECISLNAGNMIDEEVMTLSYMLRDGIVYKIVIQCGN